MKKSQPSHLQAKSTTATSDLTCRLKSSTTFTDSQFTASSGSQLVCSSGSQGQVCTTHFYVFVAKMRKVWGDEQNVLSCIWKNKQTNYNGAFHNVLVSWCLMMPWALLLMSMDNPAFRKMMLKLEPVHCNVYWKHPSEEQEAEPSAVEPTRFRKLKTSNFPFWQTQSCTMWSGTIRNQAPGTAAPLPSLHSLCVYRTVLHEPCSSKVSQKQCPLSFIHY